MVGETKSSVNEGFLRQQMNTTFDLLTNTIDALENVGMVNAMWDRVSPTEIEKRSMTAFIHIKTVLNNDVVILSKLVSKESVDYLNIKATKNKQELYQSVIHKFFVLLSTKEMNLVLCNEIILDLQVLMI